MTSLDKYISTLNFEEGIRIAKEMEPRELHKAILNFAFESNYSIVWYPFLLEMIKREETPELHYIAFEILSEPLCHLEGALEASLYHARKAIELSNSNNADYLSCLITLNYIPETIVSDKEAKEVALKILELDPNHQFAKESLERLK
ncbi:hypothetical protein P4284_18240 [Bacillus swezeyi]|uniref:hypothetical protein n=1 Tax=Bacillus swezeyi TaxID=1925020 RepID=UPI002E24EDAA|nr:hypothetical protein [Bacillus swezeyi]